MTSLQDTQAARMLQRRAELEESEGASAATVSSSLRNKLTVSSLVTLLDARKEIKSAEEYRRLCEDFNCDPQVVDRLCRHITSPSISLIRSSDQEKKNEYLVSLPKGTRALNASLTDSYTWYLLSSGSLGGSCSSP